VETSQASKNDLVGMVTQKYEETTNKHLTTQITKELQAAYIYQAYASYFQRADVALPGTQKFFADAALEEKEHAQMLIDYINTRGGIVKFDPINMTAACEAVRNHDQTKSVDQDISKRMCICNFASNKNFAECGARSEWKNALIAFEDALALERYVNQELLNLHEEAEKANDAHLTHILEHHFLDEQVNSIYQLAGYVTRLRRFTNNYNLGEYMFDQNLMKK